MFLRSASGDAGNYRQTVRQRNAAVHSHSFRGIAPAKLLLLDELIPDTRFGAKNNCASGAGADVDRTRSFSTDCATSFMDIVGAWLPTVTASPTCDGHPPGGSVAAQHMQWQGKSSCCVFSKKPSAVEGSAFTDMTRRYDDCAKHTPFRSGCGVRSPDDADDFSVRGLPTRG